MQAVKAVIQRVSRAHIVIDGVGERAIGPGLVILLGVKDTDTPALCAKLAQKCAGLRIVDEGNGARYHSAEDLGYEALVVSNFTLYADTKKGRRPGFTRAAKPPVSVDCYNELVAQMKSSRLAGVQTG